MASKITSLENEYALSFVEALDKLHWRVQEVVHFKVGMEIWAICCGYDMNAFMLMDIEVHHGI